MATTTKGKTPVTKRTRIVDEDWEEMTMNGQDMDLFLKGKYHLTDTIRNWRRVTLLMMMCQAQVLKGVAISTAIGSKKDEISGVIRTKPRMDPEDCPHPYWAQKKGANQYATYSHCYQCGLRTTFIRKNRETCKKEKMNSMPDETHDQKSVKEKRGKGKGRTENHTSKQEASSSSEASAMVDRLASTMAASLGSAIKEGLANMSELQRQAQQQQTATIMQGLEQNRQTMIRSISQLALRMNPAEQEYTETEDETEGNFVHTMADVTSEQPAAHGPELRSSPMRAVS